MESEVDWQALVTVSLWAILKLFYFQLIHSSVSTFVLLTHTSTLPGICLLLAIIKMVILLTVVRTVLPKQNKTVLEGVIIAYFSHFSATFFENFLSSSSTSSSTIPNIMLIFSLQPLLTSILVRIYLGVILPAVQIVALSILTIGALGISYCCGYSVHLNQQDAILGVVMVVLFICRNIAVKHIFLENGHLKTQWDNRVITFLVISFIVSGLIESFYKPLWMHALFKRLMSSAIHVAYTSLTLTTFLRKYSNVTVAILSMLSHFLLQIDVENILLPFQDVKLFFSMLICVCGVIIYFMSTCKYTEQTEITVKPNDQYTRLEFTVFIAIIIALFFYTLPPKVSPRDIHNFKYLGFNAVLRIF